MFHTDQIQIWNLTPNIYAVAGSQRIFNVVGNVNPNMGAKSFLYSLNGGQDREVYYNSIGTKLGRLQKVGDFNIDTIEVRELESNNTLEMKLMDHECVQRNHRLTFQTQYFSETDPTFHLSLDGVQSPEQVGQVVDGMWEINVDKLGETCLEVRPENSGLDRIILFGHQNWTTGYQISARISVSAWTYYVNNVGLVFKWNPHLQGDGTKLPSQWSTGLGYYYSHCPGLRVRYGVDVHFDSNGVKQGDYILQEEQLSPWRHFAGRILNKGLYKVFSIKNLISQIRPNIHYKFRMLVNSNMHALTVWRADEKEPKPQIEIPRPVEKLQTGSVGVIALNCGVRVYEFDVNPI